MPFSFNTILVPVDFSINSEVAINKALEVMDQGAASLHLVHVSDYSFLKTSKDHSQTGRTEVNRLLSQWKDSIEEIFASVEIHTWQLTAGSVQKAIAKKARELKADLIVIGKNSNHTWFPFLNTVIPSELAEQTGIAVLTVKPGSLHSKIKTMVVPVTDHLTENKTEIIAALSRKYKMKVHLVTFSTETGISQEMSASSFLQVYQWLKNTLHCPVEYTVLHGANKARCLLKYAEKINADILLVHPESETKIGWLNTHISDVLPSQSKMQVLTIHPIQ